MRGHSTVAQCKLSEMGKSQSKSNIVSYPTTYKEGKGYCLIFNNAKFTKYLSRGQGEKASSHNNAAAIKTTFQACGFKVETITDCTTTNITGTLERLKTCKGRNSLVIFFLSQGYSDGIYDDGGLCLSYADILSLLTAANCPTFSDKPKIIFFPNCQMGEGAESEKGAIEDDFLIAFGTPVDKDEELDSCYIRQLLSIIQEKRDEMDLKSILDEVKRALSNQPDTMPQKCDYHSTLKGQAFLTKQKRQRPSKRDFVTGLENSDIIKSKEDEKTEQVTPSHSLSPSHNIVGITTEPPRVPKRVVALKRTLSTESSTTTSSQVSTNFSINEEATGIRSPTPSEMSTGAARGTTESPKKEKILEEDESQPQTEEQGDTIKGNDAPVEEEDTREGVKESPTCPIQVKENNTTTESEHTSSSPVSWYLQIPEEVETDDGHINIVYTSKLVKEEMVREWVNLSINNVANSDSSSST